MLTNLDKAPVDEATHELDIYALIRYTRAAVRRLARNTSYAEPLIEDIEQDVIEAVLRDPERRHGPKILLQHAIHALRCWYGERWASVRHGHSRRAGFREPMVELLDNHGVEPGTGPSRAIALWRLQRVWSSLTERQQRALLEILSGERGTSATNAARYAVKRSAIRRIDRMHSYTRRARGRAREVAWRELLEVAP